MKKSLPRIVVICGLLGIGLAGLTMANGAVEGDDAAMMVSPSTIVLAKVDSITVHTNIPYGSVVAVQLGQVVPVQLEPADPEAIWPDNRGHLVARFAIVDLGLEPGDVTLTLSGVLEDGSEFSATDTVSVK